MSLKYYLALCALVLALAVPAGAETPVAKSAVADARSPGASDKVEALVAEALQHSPLIAAARSHLDAQRKVPIQVSTLPDPEVSLQHFTVGSPQPFSGYETSDFYYTGFGAMQEIPGPGKLALRARQAEKDADFARAQLEAARRSVAEKVREACFNLFYFGKAATLLNENRAELGRIEQITESDYRVGRGNQQAVTEAQLQMTAILREVEMNRQEAIQQQAELKAVLGREIDTPEIEIGDLTPTTLQIEPARIRELADAGSPELEMARATAARSNDALDLARHDYIPDFSLAYMYQKTGPHLRDYYMLTLGAKVPLYFWRKQKPAVEQAVLEKEAASQLMRAARLGADSGASREQIAIRTADRIITLYRDGLIPQSEASRAAALAGYRTGKVDFQTLLSAVIEALNLKQEYYRAIADHEIAIAKLREIVGEQS